MLIAEPGAGKTTAFETEAAKQGAVCVTVRNFLRFDKPDWRDATLFLDGLDESRAGPGDRRTPLDGIVKKLDGLGRPPFRLSCRNYFSRFVAYGCSGGGWRWPARPPSAQSDYSARNHRNPNVRPGYSPGSDAWKTTRSMMSRRWPALPKAISTPRSRVLIKSAAA